jgi:hypothetical protein
MIPFAVRGVCLRCFDNSAIFPRLPKSPLYARLPYYREKALHGPAPTPDHPERTTGGSWVKRLTRTDGSGTFDGRGASMFAYVFARISKSRS